MSYPKWRHHAELESRLVESPEVEAYLAPDDQGWKDYRGGVPPAEPEPEAIPEPAPEVPEEPVV